MTSQISVILSEAAWNSSDKNTSISDRTLCTIGFYWYLPVFFNRGLFFNFQKINTASQKEKYKTLRMERLQKLKEDRLMSKRKLEIDSGSEPKFTSNPKIRNISTASESSNDSDYKVNNDNMVYVMHTTNTEA